jgi:hypothetical protein
MAKPRTDEEKIELVKGLLKRACETMTKIHDEAMDKVELEWLKEIDEAKKNDTPEY